MTTRTVSFDSLLQRLNSHNIPLIIHIPDSDRVGSVVDPSSSIMRERFRRIMSFYPPLGLGIQPDKLAAGQHTGPDLTVLIRHSLVKTSQRIDGDRSGLNSRIRPSFWSSSTSVPFPPPNQAFPNGSNPPLREFDGSDPVQDFSILPVFIFSSCAELPPPGGEPPAHQFPSEEMALS